MTGRVTSSEDDGPMTTPEEEFDARVQIALGMSVEDARALGAEQERLRQERIRAAGYCCEAGATASPDACPWHPEATP